MLTTRIALAAGFALFLLAAPALAGVCGNGVTETAEECDDSNVSGGDGCGETCEIEAAGQRCEITFSLVTAETLSVLQFTVDYSSADGRFAGVWQDVECATTFYPFSRSALDFDPERYVRMYFLSGSGVAGPTDVFSCTFDIVTPAGDEPSAADLSIWVEDAADIDVQSVDVDVVVSRVECRGGSLCGDGTVQSFEGCDDGNDSSGDGCSDECLVETCWECTNGVLGSVCSAEPDRSPCSDGDDATTGDQCLDGTCQQGCLAIPPVDCLEAGASTLTIKDSSNDARDSFKWKWKRGAQFYLGGVGDPTESGRYSVCLYPDSGALHDELAVPALAGWERIHGTLQYKDRFGTAAGVTRIRLRSGGAGESSLDASGRGIGLPEGLLPTSSYTIQLRDHETGTCWTSTFDGGDLREVRYKASAP